MLGGAQLPASPPCCHSGSSRDGAESSSCFFLFLTRSKEPILKTFLILHTCFSSKEFNAARHSYRITESRRGLGWQGAQSPPVPPPCHGHSPKKVSEEPEPAPWAPSMCQELLLPYYRPSPHESCPIMSCHHQKTHSTGSWHDLKPQISVGATGAISISAGVAGNVTTSTALTTRNVPGSSCRYPARVTVNPTSSLSPHRA